MSDVNKIIASVEQAKMLERASFKKNDKNILKTLTKASEDLVKQISADENKYEIEIENFNTEIEKELSEQTEKIKKAEAEVVALQAKADSGDITGDEVDELAAKQKELSGLQENYNSEKKSKYKEATSKLGSISNYLDKAKEIGVETFARGALLVKNSDALGKKSAPFAKLIQNAEAKAFKEIGEKAVKAGGELIGKIKTVNKKENDIKEGKFIENISEDSAEVIKTKDEKVKKAVRDKNFRTIKAIRIRK